MDANNIIDRLEKVRRKPGGGATARCPAHQDRRASLSVDEGDDGRVLLRCFAGCSAEAIVAALGLELRDLFPDRREGGTSTPPRTAATVQPPESPGLTLAAYAQLKRLSVEFLESLGLSDVTYLRRPAVRIPYLGADGEELVVRFRLAAEGEEKFRWKAGSKGKLALYGLSRLNRARDLGYVVLVEGESDVHTLWHYGFPAVGLPGAALWREDRDAEQIAGVDVVYVSIEPDAGGEAMLGWLRQSQIRDRVRLLRLEGAKDPSDLHLIQPERFVERFEAALQAAIPYEDHEQVESELRRRQAWQTAEELAKKPAILDEFERELRGSVVGEARVVRLLYLIVTSRLLAQPSSAVIKGPSAGGKSYTLAEVLRFFPDSAYFAMTGMSERALAYLDESLEHRVLVVFEAAALENEFAAYLVRSLLSEGRLKYFTVEKAGDGLRSRVIDRPGPTSLLVTTTAVSLHAENETRLLSITVTDTAEQTAAVMQALAREQGGGPDLERWHALQEWLETGSREVTIPFAPELAAAVPPVAVRLRRDFGAILNLIRAHALLHQAQRARDSAGRIVATIDDYVVVRELVADLVAEGVEATVPDTVRETVAAVAHRLSLQQGAELIESADSGGVAVVAVAGELKLDKSAAWRRVRASIARGFLRNLETRRGRPARLVLGDPLPDELELLPAPERLCGPGCTVAAVSEGIEQSPSLSDDPDEELARLRRKRESA